MSLLDRKILSIRYSFWKRLKLDCVIIQKEIHLSDFREKQEKCFDYSFMSSLSNFTCIFLGLVERRKEEITIYVEFYETNIKIRILI